MGREDWYRNLEWNDDIETQFFQKLNRARDKAQYLRIQASILAQKKPDISLNLLEQYFALNDDFGNAPAYCDMASAFLAKGEVDKSIESYGKALAREEEFPNILTGAYLLYPLTIAENKRANLYQQAIDVLDKHLSRLTFPVEYFQWNAAKAIIAAEYGDKEQASKYVESAFDAAEIKKSGFRYHQSLGLVGEEYKALIKELRSISS
ncbi:M48 family metallopeptidase [Pleionea sp. CnH1-48]|uniref:tetratricopeptide repeat protein n=1 Tax=Pleionea sp. CnH1-48 TaxID=2954494 RepID=UPI0020981875|nr:hypothetical protein [Pleionea sp. CnH1-48]MCO7224129.1 hypothetical protein [Pleionea sp. CnH1-48]